jgi:hypothetical protein
VTSNPPRGGSLFLAATVSVGSVSNGDGGNSRRPCRPPLDTGASEEEEALSEGPRTTSAANAPVLRAGETASAVQPLPTTAAAVAAVTTLMLPPTRPATGSVASAAGGGMMSRPMGVVSSEPAGDVDPSNTATVRAGDVLHAMSHHHSSHRTRAHASCSTIAQHNARSGSKVTAATGTEVPTTAVPVPVPVRDDELLTGRHCFRYQ